MGIKRLNQMENHEKSPQTQWDVINPVDSSFVHEINSWTN